MTKKIINSTLTYKSVTHGIFTATESDYVNLQNWFKFGVVDYKENGNFPDVGYLIDTLKEITDNDYSDVDSIAALLIILASLGWEPQ